MTAPPKDLLAYHLGFVVHDVNAVADRYQRLLGVDRWRIHDLVLPPVPWLAESTEATLTVAFGRGAGLTFELIQVREGRTVHSDFLETRGEGVQHIGIWTSDVRAAVENAVNLGGRVTLARIDPTTNNAIVEVTPESSMDTIVRALDPSRVAYVDPGIGGVQLEFVGPAGAPSLRGWMGEDFDRIMMQLPPWERSTV